MEIATPPQRQLQSTLAVSLQTFFLILFLTACLSRWFARFGLGLAVGFVWCAVFGIAIGGAIRVLLIPLPRIGGNRTNQATFDSRELLVVAIAGLAGAIVGAALGFVAFAPAHMQQIVVQGMWFEAVVDSRAANAFQTTRVLAVALVAPAVVGSLTNAVACTYRASRSTPQTYMASVCSKLGLLFGFLPLLLIIIALAFAPPASPPPPGHENMLGLLPLALPIWCLTTAIIGVFCGAIASASWLWAWHAKDNRISWLVFWFAVIWTILFVTEAGLVRGSRKNNGSALNNNPLIATDYLFG